MTQDSWNVQFEKGVHIIVNVNDEYDDDRRDVRIRDGTRKKMLFRLEFFLQIVVHNFQKLLIKWQ